MRSVSVYHQGVVQGCLEDVRMSRCWEIRGCKDEQIQADCPHAAMIGDRCPAKCAFAQCDLEQHERTSDPALIFEPEIDRTAAIKEGCTYCAFFLRNGPRLSGSGTHRSE